jgi:hypothetical protein
LAEIRVAEAELELFAKLKAAGVVLCRDENGNYTVLPSPPDGDLDILALRRALPSKDANPP